MGVAATRGGDGVADEAAFGPRFQAAPPGSGGPTLRGISHLLAIANTNRPKSRPST